MFCLVSQSQSLYTLRFWFDQEQAETIISNSNSEQIELDAGTLPSGLHMLYLHVKDSTGVWSAPQYFLFYKASAESPINAGDASYHCWFDQDFEHQQSGQYGSGQFLLDAAGLEPGLHMLYVVLEGNGMTSAQYFLFYKASAENPVNVDDVTYRCWFDQDFEHQQSGQFGSGQFLLDAAGLEPGLHMLYVVLEGNGMTSAQYFLFYKASAENPVNVDDVTYRCWFDQDFEHQQSGQFGSGQFLLDAAGLEPGLHMLYVVLEGNGMTSAQYFLFYKANAENPVNVDDVSYRCWFDQDFEHQQSGPFGTGQFLLDVAGLEPGLHMLYVVLEGNGMSSAQYFLFYKASAENPVNPNNVVLYYWFDEDFEHEQSGSFGTGAFLLDASGLEDGSHVVSIMLKNGMFTSTQSYSFEKGTVNGYTVITMVNPIEGGTVIGAGTYEEGEICTVTAFANPNYTFTHWTENNNQVATEPTYSFTVTEDRTLMANFDGAQSQTYIISAMVTPSGSGTVTGGGGYTIGSTCTLHATPAQGYFFLNWTQNGNVVSTNPSYSFTVMGNATYTAHFMPGLPELHVTGITHSEFMAGQPVTVSWTVQNDGDVTTPNGALWHDRVWLSVESRVAADDNNPILLGTFDNISALGVGEYYTQTHTFNIPIDMVGEYYLFVLTDAYDCHTIYWDSTGVQLPYNPPPYIGCLSHHCPSCPNVADNLVYEKSEYEHGEGPGGYYNDNFFYTLVDIAVPLVPDLQVTSIITPDNFFSGTDVNVTATVSNLGENITLSEYWADALYIGSEPDFNSATCIAIVSHSGALPVGSSYQVSFTGHIPLTTYGEAYFFVYTDCYEQVYEHVLNHNNMAMSEAVNIILSPPADLQPCELTVPSEVSTAESFAYSYKVQNIGAGNPNVANWVDKVYLSHNADTLGEDAVLLKTHSHYNGLEPGASYSVSESLALPSEITAGTCYLYVVADADNAVFEYLYDDNNSVRSSQITVKAPDLQVTQVSVPEQITSGHPLNLSYVLTNQGDGAIVNRNMTDRIYISASGTLSDTTLIASKRYNVNLSVGQSMTLIYNDLAPTNLMDGTFHLLVVTDANNEINESNESNNVYSYYPMEVLHQPLPDLQPVSLNLPSTIQAGETISVDFDVTNIGDLALLNSNCTFNIYAVMGEEEILCPVQSQTLPLGSNVSIGINETVHFVRSVLVPASVTSACSTFQLIADKENHVMELDTTNNIFEAVVTVLDAPLPDLVVSNVVLPTMQAGTEAQVSFTVSNNGTADFSGIFETAIYTIYDADTVSCPLQVQLSPEANGNYVLPVGNSLPFTQKVLVPPMVTSAFGTFYVAVDAENTILETNDDNNVATAITSVIDYPFNLITQTFEVPSSITAGEATSVSWTVKNNGTCPNEQIPFYMSGGDGYVMVEGETLPNPWMDRVYLSDDAVWDENDLQLLSVDHNLVLQPNGTYSVEQIVTLPYSAVGSKYLLCVSDATQLTFDNNRADNVVAALVEVELGVLPDLHLMTLEVEPNLISDRSYWLHYTIANEGERVTQRDSWADAFYVSENQSVIGAFLLTSKVHHGALEVGQSYADSVEILVPNGLEGDYFLLGYTDATNQIYEHENEGNNVMGVDVTISSPEPCDLVAVQPEFPVSVVSGEEMTVSWQLRNIGSNPATGRIRNAVYLSKDALWSSDDVMLGFADADISILAGGELSCQLSGTLTGFDEGAHYVIVKVNILNALNESTYENNVCVSLLTTEIGFPTLEIGESVTRMLESEQYIYYKLQVGQEYEGQTLLCHLDSPNMDFSVANGIYLSHESVPTLADFDYADFAPFSHALEIIVPSLEQGTYYLLVKGSAYELNVRSMNYYVVPQLVEISTSILNFEILSIDADHGANTGSITTKVTGAKFDSIMDFRLVQGGEYLPAEKVFFSNSTETFTTFDLVDMPAGTYDMEAELPGGIITIKGEAFTIEEGLPAELAVNIVAPSSVRRGNTFAVNIEYGNIGTTDLNVSGFVVVSRNGHPIGFTTDDLEEELNELTFSTGESNGNPDVMRPGYRNTKAILVKATPETDISLAVYAIRRQY